MPNYFSSVYYGSPYFAYPQGMSPTPFEGYAITLRKLIAAVITDGKEADQFLFNNFTVEETHLQYEDLVTLNKDHPNGKLYLSALPFDQENISRSNAARQTVPVLIGFVKGNVKHTSLAQIDTLVSFVEQVQYVLRAIDPARYSWARTDAIKDENGVPYGSPQLVQQGVFESYFIPHYHLVVE
jgi:hypothetical protein